MKSRLVWTPQARKDLIEIYIAIGLDNLTAAERVYAAIEEKIGLLAQYPRIGVRRPEIAASARMLVQGEYLVLYEARPDGDDGIVDEVEIVRIVHGRRDLSQVF